MINQTLKYFRLSRYMTFIKTLAILTSYFQNVRLRLGWCMGEVVVKGGSGGFVVGSG